MGVGDEVENPKNRSQKLRDIFFGPELGIANTIAEYASEENPVHLIKCAFSGSGFTKTDGPNWANRDEDPTKSLFHLLKTYTYNCLEAIEETGKVPVLKGFIWHQGESDTGNNNYQTQMETLKMVLEGLKGLGVDIAGNSEGYEGTRQQLIKEYFGSIVLDKVLEDEKTMVVQEPTEGNPKDLGGDMDMPSISSSSSIISGPGLSGSDETETTEEPEETDVETGIDIEPAEEPEGTRDLG